MARTLARRSSVIFVTVGAVVEAVEGVERGREGVRCCSLRTIACSDKVSVRLSNKLGF